MNPEKVYSMITEKSISINDLPGGGIPEFTPDDARHALGGMKPPEFAYCQYIFLLYDDCLDELTRHVLRNYIKYNNVKKLNADALERLARLSCIAQQRGGKIMNKDLYVTCNFTKGAWRHTWKDVYSLMNSHLNELRVNVGWHIYNKTKNDDN